MDEWKLVVQSDAGEAWWWIQDDGNTVIVEACNDVARGSMLKAQCAHCRLVHLFPRAIVENMASKITLPTGTRGKDVIEKLEQEYHALKVRTEIFRQ